MHERRFLIVRRICYGRVSLSSLTASGYCVEGDCPTAATPINGAGVLFPGVLFFIEVERSDEELT